MAMYKPKRVNTAVFMLYAVSVLGILELFTSASVTGKLTPLLSVDIIAYACLFFSLFCDFKRNRLCESIVYPFSCGLVRGINILFARAL